MNKNRFKRKVFMRIILKYIFTTSVMIGGLFLILTVPYVTYFAIITLFIIFICTFLSMFTNFDIIRLKTYINFLFSKKYNKKEFKDIYNEIKKINIKEENNTKHSYSEFIEKILETTKNIEINEILVDNNAKIEKIKNEYGNSYFRIDFSDVDKINTIISGKLFEKYNCDINYIISKKHGHKSGYFFNNVLFSSIDILKDMDLKIISMTSFSRINDISRTYPIDIKNIVNVDNTKFDKSFAVFEAREGDSLKIFTREMTNFLVEFKKEYGMKFEITIKDKVFIYFNGTNLLRVNKKKINKMDVYTLYCVFKFIEEFTKIYENK